MRVSSFARVACAVATSLLLFACAVNDDPTAPPVRSAAPAAAAHSLLGNAVAVNPVTWNRPLPAPISVSQTIGVLGGVIWVPATGLTVTVPPLAVSQNTRFTVTALAGSNVAYDFQPAGTRFAVPLVAVQGLNGTSAGLGGSVNPLSLFAGYFTNDSSPNLVSELLNVSVSLANQMATFNIWHFSGYVLAGD